MEPQRRAGSSTSSTRASSDTSCFEQLSETSSRPSRLKEERRRVPPERQRWLESKTACRTYTVSALEYRLLHASGGDRPHIQADEESRIPELMAGIEALGHRAQAALQEKAWQGALS